MSKIMRLTLFKIPEPAHIEEAIAKYSTMTKDAVKDGKPYILNAAASRPYDDPRAKGYTLVARTVFPSKADMDYYDTECAAHQELKAMLKGKVVDGPPLTVFMDMPESA
ncbi:hypothetical protein K504DRAFT_461195 [Pleomassaria siparia CBS 279.74]|uniref:Stress-response A/B barrel domain-containing protein n=1 Tax=Pleomassaria siparia CBS 279.74 TaxID=1314801 RepID=A0A6G1JVS5_9PLEO|nr:hypothetical protein K504DRAFT_461195 [Pleomassaria siparia CBS 279.74]